MFKPFLIVALSVLLLLSLVPLSDAQNKLLEPVNLGKTINTKADETDPFLMPDGLRLIYCSNVDGTFDLAVGVRKAIDKPFDQVVPLKVFNTKNSNERSPYFYGPAKDMYFASDEVPEGFPKDTRNFDILFRSGDAAPAPLVVLNSPVDELFPWITANGNEFFFSRKSKDGWRLCSTNGPNQGAPGKGTIVEEIPAGFHHATFMPDGLTMYLEGPVEKGRTGLFRSTRKKIGGEWTKPQPIINLNHPEGKLGDMAPALSATGQTLFFASDRPGGQGGLDLWAVATAQLKVE